MHKVFIYGSEMDGSSMHVCGDDDVSRFERKNKPIRPTKQISLKPWHLACTMEFDRPQQAGRFMDFLGTLEGREFANRYIFVNPLAELKRLLDVLPESCPVYVIGGWSVDGHVGRVTRRHNDVDLMCWRKDLATVKEGLKKIGYKVREKRDADGSGPVRMIETDEENPVISFFVIDEVPGKGFRLVTNKVDRTFPMTYLRPKKARLYGVEFAAVSLRLVDFLSREGRKTLKAIKKSNPGLYKAIGQKVANSRHDRALLNGLIK